MLSKNHKYIFSNQGILLIIILVVCFFSYIQIINYEFLQWDDDAQITNNAYVKNLNWQSINYNLKWERYTFLTLTTYSVFYNIWGNNPAPFHWLSIILHLLNVVLIFQLLKQFTKNIFTIGFVLLLFALHPTRVESVAWISEIKDLLFTFFSLTAFLFYFKYLKNNFNIYFFILAALMCVLASFSKIQGLLVPISFCLIDIFYKRKFSKELILEKAYLIFIIFNVFIMLNIKILAISSILLIIYYFLLRKRLSNFIKSIKISLFGLIGLVGLAFLIYCFYGIFIVYGFSLDKLYLWSDKMFLWSEVSESINNFSFVERFLLAGFSLWFYLKNFFFPVFLNAVHPYPVRLSNGELPTEYYLTLIVLLLIIIFSIFLILKRKKIPDLIFFGWFFFLVNISMVLHFIPIQGRLVVADRYSYLAYFGLFISVATIGEKYLFHIQKLKKILIICFVFLLCAFSFLTYNRCKVWENTKILFTDVLQKNPLIPFAYCNLAATYRISHMPDSAIICFNKAIKLDSLDPSAYFNRAFAFLEKKNDKDALKDFTHSLRLTKNIKFKALTYTHIGEIYTKRGNNNLDLYYYDLAIKTDSTLPTAYNCRGKYFINKNKIEKAYADFIKALKLDIYYAEAFNNLGSVFLALGKLKEAQKYFNRAIELEPDYILAYANRGYVKYNNGNTAGAIKDFNKAINLDTTFNQAYIYRGRTYASMRDYKNAINDFSFVLKKEPNNMIALTNRAYALYYIKEFTNSENDFILNTKLYPDNANVWQNLAWYHMELKNYESAINEYEKSIELDSTLIVSFINLGWIYLELKNYEKADNLLKISLNLNPKSSESLFFLGELNRKKGNNKTSCEYYKRSSDLGNTQAKNALDLNCKSNN